MKFSIKETDDGEFQVIQEVPTIMGRFSEIKYAAIFKVSLIDAAMDAVTATTPILKTEKPNIVPKTLPKKLTSIMPWKKTELEEAFVLLAAGYKAVDVAKSYGKPLQALCGSYGFYVKTQKKFSRKTQNSHYAKCTLCGKQFEPTSSRIDHCSGCYDEL